MLNLCDKFYDKMYNGYCIRGELLDNIMYPWALDYAENR